MAIFSKKKPRFTREQQLAARPIQLVNGELTETESGAKLKVKLQTSRFAGLVLRMPKGATKTFELDSIGLLVWNSCDGKTSVQRIIRNVSKQYNLNLREAEVPTLTFLQTLGKKGLIGFPVEKKKS